MHQGMMGLMDAISPLSIGILKHKNYALPWSVFSSPEISQVGMTEKEAKNKGIKYQVTKKDYISYGLTVSVGKPEGFIKVIHSSTGKIYGVSIIGENSSELINEWTLAIQKKIRLHDMMMTMHSFPSFSMLNKMVTEDWMMGVMKNDRLQKLIKWLF
jgi:pyruvate/2-oxoglutarate dehydrogenase complex dihydrolipoamide dehydrogenase (E3) component